LKRVITTMTTCPEPRHIRRPGATIAAVVLGMDGLMLDTEPLYEAAWQQTPGLIRLSGRAEPAAGSESCGGG